MKRIIPIVVLILLMMTSCEQHVFHTYYGDIDTDTMTAYYENKIPFYILEKKDIDTVLSNAMGLDRAIQVVFYIPSENKYFMKWYGSDGGRSARIYFDPYKENTK